MNDVEFFENSLRNKLREMGMPEMKMGNYVRPAMIEYRRSSARATDIFDQAIKRARKEKGKWTTKTAGGRRGR
jgi:hypothetical protein